MSTQHGPQLPSFLAVERNPEHVLSVPIETPLPSPREKMSGKIINILLFAMAIAIMGLTFSAILGNDPTSIRVPNKELKD
jgi:hypothetical protein